MQNINEIILFYALILQGRELNNKLPILVIETPDISPKQWKTYLNLFSLYSKPFMHQNLLPISLKNLLLCRELLYLICFNNSASHHITQNPLFVVTLAEKAILNH